MSDGLILVAILAILLVGVAALIVLWKFSRRFWHLIAEVFSLFGRTAQVRIVGLGIVAWLFPRAVATPFYIVFNPIYTIVQQLPQLLTEFASMLSVYESSSRTRLIGTFASDISNVMARALYSITTAFYIPEFVMAMMVWVVVGQILDTIWADDQHQNRLFTFFQSMQYSRRQNFYLVVLLLFGSYLSIAAIASIPWLRETETPIETDSARLATRLAEIRLSDQEFSKRFGDPPADLKAFHDLETFINANLAEPSTSGKGSNDAAANIPATDQKKPVIGKAEAAGNGPSAQQGQRATSTTPVVTAPALTNANQTTTGNGPSEDIVAVERQNIRQTLNDVLSRAQTDRGERLRQWHDLVTRSRDQENKLLKTVSTAFEENSVGRKGSQERALYFEELDDWYRENVSSIDDRLGICLNSINLGDDQSARTAQTGQEWATAHLESIRLAQKNGYPIPADSGVSYLFNTMYNDVGACTSVPFEESLPEPPTPGASWGPFGFVASWLLKTESLQLALITGMLGFGLLGSAVSSFVQEGKPHSLQVAKPSAEGAPLVSDLPALLIRGFSAAIVVFLAAEGGLAIFSGSGSVDPNPYILMFTCFTAAVFSRNAWERVREKIEEGKAKKGQPPNSSKDKHAPPPKIDSAAPHAHPAAGSETDKSAPAGEQTGDESEANKQTEHE